MILCTSGIHLLPKFVWLYQPGFQRKVLPPSSVVWLISPHTHPIVEAAFSNLVPVLKGIRTVYSCSLVMTRARNNQDQMDSMRNKVPGVLQVLRPTTVVEQLDVLSPLTTSSPSRSFYNPTNSFHIPWITQPLPFFLPGEVRLCLRALGDKQPGPQHRSVPSWLLSSNRVLSTSGWSNAQCWAWG